MTDGWGISCEIAQIWLPLDYNYEKSTLVQLMAWCHQATSHYLSQCWPRSLSPYGVTRPQWVMRLVGLSLDCGNPHLQWILDKLQCIMCICDQWEFPPVFRGPWPSHNRVQTALPAVRAVQGVCERVTLALGAGTGAVHFFTLRWHSVRTLSTLTHLHLGDVVANLN